MKKVVALSIFFCTSFLSLAQNESKQAINAMKNAIGAVIKDYTVYSYPTNNFGVGTSCYNKWVPKGTMLCDMTDCLGLGGSSANSDLWKRLNGFAYFGQGGPLQLDDSITSSYGIGVLLPKILQTLQINLSVGGSKTRSVHLRIDSAVLRYLNFGNFKNFVLSQKNPALYDAWQRRKLMVVSSDFVLLDYSLEINPADSFGLRLSAVLDSMSQLAPKVLAGKDSLGVSIVKKGTGQFSLKSTKPVVFAIYVSKQKKLEPKEATKTFKDWESGKPDEFIDPQDYMVPKKY